MSRVVADGEEYSVTREQLVEMDAFAEKHNAKLRQSAGDDPAALAEAMKRVMTREQAAREVFKPRKAPSEDAGVLKKK